jgi:hypothetical protein
MKIARSFNCGFGGKKSISPAGATEFLAMVLSAAPPGLDLLGGFYPQLKLRAILGCSCGTRPSRRKPLVEKLERCVKFKPQTTLREIIRLTAPN